jgi:hypothetical protein
MSQPLPAARLSTSSTRSFREELESSFNPALGGSRVHSTCNIVPIAPDMIGHQKPSSFYVTKNDAQDPRAFSQEKEEIQGSFPTDNTASYDWKTQVALRSEDTKAKYNPESGQARRLHSFFSSPSSSKINQSQSYSERSQHQATRAKNTSISSKEFLGKAAIRSDRSIVSSSADIPETEAAAQAHIQAIRNEKREYSGGRNAKDLEAALEL